MGAFQKSQRKNENLILPRATPYEVPKRGNVVCLVAQNDLLRC